MKEIRFLFFLVYCLIFSSLIILQNSIPSIAVLVEYGSSRNISDTVIPYSIKCRKLDFFFRIAVKSKSHHSDFMSWNIIGNI